MMKQATAATDAATQAADAAASAAAPQPMQAGGDSRAGSIVIDVLDGDADDTHVERQLTGLHITRR